MKRTNITQSQRIVPQSKISQLEQDLFAKIGNAFTEEHHNSEVVIPPQNDLLAQAKQRVQDKRTANPKFFEEGKRLQQQQQMKRGTFMITAVNTISHTKPPVPEEEVRDVHEMLDDLIKQEQPYDDLAELRRMIKATEIQMQGYAGDMYHWLVFRHRLNSNISKTNSEANKLGMGVNSNLMDHVDKKLTKYLQKSSTQATIKRKY